MKEIIQAASQFAQDHGYYPDSVLLGIEERKKLMEYINEIGSEKFLVMNEDQCTNMFLYGETECELQVAGLKVIPVDKKNFLRVVI